MKEETITKYVDQLAKGLNVASEHVYGALLKQALVSGIMNTLFSVVLLAIIVVTIVVTIRWVKAIKADRFWDTGDEILPILGAIFAVFILTLILTFTLYDALTALLNPEYWAIREVINAIKS